MSASTTLLHLFNMYGWYGRKNYFASHTANTNTININTENNFVTCLIHSCTSFMHVTSGLCFIEYQVAYCTNKKILWLFNCALDSDIRFKVHHLRTTESYIIYNAFWLLCLLYTWWSSHRELWSQARYCYRTCIVLVRPEKQIQLKKNFGE